MRQALAAVIVLAAGFGFAQVDKKDDKKPTKLEGTYLIVAIEFGGEKLPAEFFDKAPVAERTIKITADKLIANKGGKDDPIAYKIDTSKSPAHITTTEMKPGGKSEMSYGIYKVDGETLTICMIENGKEEDRPKEFKSTKDNKAVIMVLKKKGK